MKRIVNGNIFTKVAIVLIIAARIHTALIRYFDNDEFSHMHWVWLMASGKIPYRDFFFYITPFFQWIQIPIFLLPPGGYVLLIARLSQLVTYLAVTFLIYMLSRKFADKTTAILAAVIFLTFPMTFDKTIDIRPDTLMMLLYLIPVYIAINSKPLTPLLLVLGGASISLGFLMLPKILFAIPALLYLFMLTKQILRPKNIVLFLLGALIPAIILMVYLVSHGILQDAFLAITRDSVAVNAGKSPFSPWKALSPWPLVYMAEGGPSLPWYVNTGIWITALAGLILYFIKKPAFGVFFLLYFAAGILFLFLFPAPYLQYFFPLSVFAAFLSAYLYIYCIRALIRLAGTLHVPKFGIGIMILSYGVLALLLGTSFTQQYLLRVSPGMANTEQMSVIADLPMIRSGESVYDMVGSYVFRPDGYFICCHPYQEFVDNLSRKVPTLRESLIATKTKFIILDRTGMSLWQPRVADLDFLKKNYLPSAKNWKIYPLGVKFLCYNGSCFQADADNRVLGDATATLTIPIGETFTLATVPEGNSVTIDGKMYSQKVPLSAGTYSFTIPDTISEFTLKLVR